jgi:hypothetical protein
MFYTILYFSKAKWALDQHELSFLLEQSRAWNDSHGLTGFLAYVEGTDNFGVHGRFIQVLEGSEKDVTDIFANIQVDSRHHHISVIKKGPITQRKFSFWKMGFEKVTIGGNPDLQTFFTMNPEVLAAHGDINDNMLMQFMTSFYAKGN